MKIVYFFIILFLVETVLYAIPAYNAAAGASRSIGSTATTLSWTHTVASRGVLFVYVQINGTHTCSSVAYGGVSLDLISTVTSGNSKLYVYYTASPPTGAARNVTVTTSARGDTVGQSISYTGVVAIGTPTTFANASARSCTIATTIQYPNSWYAGVVI